MSESDEQKNREDTIEVHPDDDGWIACPKCGVRYTLRDQKYVVEPGVWQHRCGQQVSATYFHVKREASNPPTNASVHTSGIKCWGCSKVVPEIYLHGKVIGGGFGKCPSCNKIWCNDCAKKQLYMYNCPNCDRWLKHISD